VSTEGELKTKAIHWLAARLPPCDAIARTVSESLERRLTPRERVQRRLHFLVCDLCSRYEHQIRMLRKTVRERARDVESSGTAPGLSTEARERMKKALRGDAD
jgi:hypothetical protein